MSASVRPGVSPEEYLALDRAAEYKSEYFDGTVYAMSGGTLAHSLIAVNVRGSLRSAARGSGCFATSSDLRLAISPSKYVYPDCMVYCGQPKLADNHQDTLLNPVLVLEVLSPATEACDRGFKFAQYRRLESLREYALISQSEPLVEIYRRQPDNEFKLSEYSDLEQLCRFDSISCSIPMSEIYLGIDFAA